MVVDTLTSMLLVGYTIGVLGLQLVLQAACIVVDDSTLIEDLV